MAETSPDDQDFFQRMVEMIERRYQVTTDKSLRDVYLLDSAFLNTQTDADFASRNREKILAVLRDPRKVEALVQVFLNQSVEFTYASNQFVQLDAREKRELRRIYTEYLRELERVLNNNRTEDAIVVEMQKLVAGHFLDLRANITRFFDPEAQREKQANVILNRVVNAEYTPVLQLEILGLDLSQLAAPVIDIGCGKSGGLVQYLNENGIQAVGVDRMVGESPSLIQADWLELPLTPGVWGTVISHMAFSNHFLFQHLYKHGQVEPYAVRYMEILQSLKVGGSFYYTPGLPFIEAFLPVEQYRVTRKTVQENIYAVRVLRVR